MLRWLRTVRCDCLQIMAEIDAIDVAIQGKVLEDDKRQQVVESCGNIAKADVAALQQLALDAAEYPEVRDILRETNGIEALLALVESTAASLGTCSSLESRIFRVVFLGVHRFVFAEARGAALKLLFQGSIENDQNPSVIAANGGMSILAATLADGSDYTSEQKVDAVGTLFNVTSFANDGAEPVANEAIVGNIVNLLRSATVDEEGKAWAAGTLQNLAGGHPEHRSIIGGTPNAVATLLSQARSKSTSTDTRRIMVAALYNLTIDKYVYALPAAPWLCLTPPLTPHHPLRSATNQEIILSNNGVDTLVWLLKCGAKTLGASQEGASAAAASSGGGDEGGEDFIDVAVTTMAYAAGALQNLAFDRAERQKEIFQAGGVQALLSLIALPLPPLTGPEGQPADYAEEEAFLGCMELRTNAAGALFNLTGGHSDDIDRYLQSSGHIGDLVALLRSSDAETITNAAGAIFNITCELEDVKNAVGNAGEFFVFCDRLSVACAECSVPRPSPVYRWHPCAAGDRHIR